MLERAFFGLGHLCCKQGSIIATNILQQQQMSILELRAVLNTVFIDKLSLSLHTPQHICDEFELWKVASASTFKPPVTYFHASQPTDFSHNAVLRKYRTISGNALATCKPHVSLIHILQSRPFCFNMNIARPSTYWSDFGGLTKDSGRLFEQISDVLRTADFKYLENAALDARRLVETELDPATRCQINLSKLAHGFNNIALEVAFSDEVYWIAKIQHAPIDETDGIYMRSEIATLKLVKARTSIPVPQIYLHQACATNEFQYPFTLMQYMPGRELKGGIAKDVPAEYLPKVARQLAQILFELEHRLAFPSLEMLWCGDNDNSEPEIIPVPSLDSSENLEDTAGSGTSPRTSLEWFYALTQSQNSEAMEQHPDDREWSTACWAMKNALTHIVVDDRVHGPFPLCHLDLHHGNLLFDEDFNLTGVLDWAQAQTVPLERLAVSPEFVSGPGSPAEIQEATMRLVDLIAQSLQDLEREEGVGDDQVSSPLSTSQGDDGMTVTTRKRKRSTDADTRDSPDEEAQTTGKTTLADILGTKRAEITNRCTYGSSRVVLWFGRMVHKLIYEDHFPWEQAVEVFGDLSPL